MRSDDPELRACKDAVIACYLNLRGAGGLEVVERQFFTNPAAGDADLHAAIQAIRFHGQEETIIDKKRLAATLRLVLARPTFADLVVADLARWADWSALPQLVELFECEGGSSTRLRASIVRFVRVCPLPEAKVSLEGVTRIDPEVVKRAALPLR